MADDTTFQIRRVFKAPIARILKAYTDPGLLWQWWCPEGFRFAEVQIDPETGYGNRFSMVSATGDMYTWAMDYGRVDAPNKLEWTSTPIEGFGFTGPMRGTLELREAAGGTEVTLTQSGYPDSDTRDSHRDGSESGWDKLEQYLALER
jgi:uncharacterized protein YndB with AHSA1/START domain